MKVKELNEIRSKMYYEIIKNEEVSEMLKHYTQVYVFDIFEGSKHEIVTVGYLTQMNKSFLKEHGFTENAFVKLLYTVNKQVKSCF